ncbi:ATP-binding cassette domain-containing protein [Streptomyces sp. NPDC048417]|uniref:ATP-binding cassette domain-containing protein n=1 Tax=Streptomyces sp. NPDC048417 TaxID=3155387 RepID=UPI00342C6873
MPEKSSDPMVFAEGLRKQYGATHALRGLDLSVPAGTVCGLLGPNGAGKTTAVRVLTTLTDPDAGTARVAGYDVTRQTAEVRFHIGLAGQHPAVDEKLTGRENLRMFGRLYHIGERAARRRADELLERFGLMDAADRLAKTYSGGMLRRLHLIASLIVAPPVLFLDEPTTGLDPRSRGEIWDAVRALVDNGTTVLLTTQYLDEADRLAHSIAVVNTGRVIATGTPDELKAAIGTRVDVVVTEAGITTAAEVLARLTGSLPAIDRELRQVSVASAGAVTLPHVVRALDAAGVETEDVSLRKPTLDEVFLKLTGKPTTDTAALTDPTDTEPAGRAA